MASKYNILVLVYLLFKYFFSNTKRYLNIFILIIKFRPRSILEIGIYKAIRSVEMIRIAKIFNDKIYYYGFDLFEEMNLKKKNIELSKIPLSKEIINDRIKKYTKYCFLYKGDTTKTLKKFNKKKIDLIFIDGGHTLKTIKNDWNYCKKIANDNSIIIFDDYYINNKKIIKKYGCNNLIDQIKDRYEVYYLPFTDYFLINNQETGIKMVLVKIKK
jgi:predicted O-methyltransferase YrrM